MTNILPQSREAEEAVVGSLLINPGKLPLIKLGQGDFLSHKIGFVFQAMRNLESRGTAVDLLTVTDELDRMGRLQEIGGPAYLTELINQVPNSLNAEYYADIVRAKAVDRRDIALANQIVQQVYSGTFDRARAIDALANNEDIDHGAVQVKDELSAFYGLVEERSKDPQDVWGIPTGLVDLDRITGGLHAQQTFMLAGVPEAGKTWIALQIALNAALEKIPGVIYELEMDLNSILTRFIALLSGVPTRAMLSGRMDEHWPKFTKAIDTLASLPLYINDSPAMDTSIMRADVARLKAQKQIRYIFVDYLNLLNDKDGSDGLENARNKAQRFRKICREFDLAGLAIKSMTKDGMMASVPVLGHMSGPAEEHYGADTVFFLIKDKEVPTLYKMLPSKLRHGDIGKDPINLVKMPSSVRFECVRHEEERRDWTEKYD